MGSTFSGKTPIAVKAKASRTKTKAPILLNVFSWRNVNSPVAKRMARAPVIMSPLLNRTAVTPSWMPRSLRAFSVQLKLGEYATASNIKVNAIGGAIMPLIPDIFSQFIAKHLVSFRHSNRL